MPRWVSETFHFTPALRVWASHQATRMHKTVLLCLFQEGHPELKLCQHIKADHNHSRMRAVKIIYHYNYDAMKSCNLICKTYATMVQQKCLFFISELYQKIGFWFQNLASLLWKFGQLDFRETRDDERVNVTMQFIKHFRPVRFFLEKTQ